MGGKSNALENEIVDGKLRGQPISTPATVYVKLIQCDGKHAASTAYTLNQLIGIEDDNGKWKMYECTTAGTSAASKPSYPGGANEVIADGTAVFTNQNAGMESGAKITELSGGSYAAQAVTASLANWAGTQGAGTTTVSTGTEATTSNNNVIPFPDPTADWGWVFGFIIDDVVSGSLGKYIWAEFTNGPVNIVNGVTNAAFAAGALKYTEDS